MMMKIASSMTKKLLRYKAIKIILVNVIIIIIKYFTRHSAKFSRIEHNLVKFVRIEWNLFI